MGISPRQVAAMVQLKRLISGTGPSQKVVQRRSVAARTQEPGNETDVRWSRHRQKEQRKIGEGQHERFIVHLERFMNR